MKLKNENKLKIGDFTYHLCEIGHNITVGRAQEYAPSMSKKYGCQFYLYGNGVRITGDPESVKRVADLVCELNRLPKCGNTITAKSLLKKLEKETK